MFLFFKFCRSFERHDTLHKIPNVPFFTTTPPWLKLPTDLPLLDIRALVLNKKGVSRLFPAVILLRLHQRIFTVITAERFVLPAPGWPCYFPAVARNKASLSFPDKGGTNFERKASQKISRAVSGVPGYTGMFTYSIDGYADETLRIDWDRE